MYKAFHPLVVQTHVQVAMPPCPLPAGFASATESLAMQGIISWRGHSVLGVMDLTEP